MNTPTSNAISPSSSIYSSSTVGSSIGRSTSNRSLYRDFTSATSFTNISSLASGSTTGARKPMGRSRQNTTDLMTGEDLVRTIGSDYQEIQKRTLTKWVNTQLNKVDDRISNIETDFKDGRKLLKLLSVVSKEPAPKPEKMNMRIHQLANVAQALSFLEKQLGADSIVDMGNEAIVNGDKKKTLALIFFIMIKYQIQVVLNDHGDDFTHTLLEYSDRQRDGLVVEALTSPTAVSTAPTATAPAAAPTATHDKAPTTPIPGTHPLLATRKLGSNYSINSDKQHTSSAESKLALLFWVRIQLEDYIAASIIPSVQDFSRSWRNGLAFCLLIHRHGANIIPDLFSYHLKDADLTQRQTWHRLLTLAFDVATQQMNIPRYLDPEDLVDVDYPHEPSVMMYVAEFYKVMSPVQNELSPEQRHEIAIRRRTGIAMVTGGIDNLYTGEDDLGLDHINNTITTATTTTAANDDDDQGVASSNLDDNDEKTSNAKKKNRKKAHRRSTLAEEDKERIKADLNSRLMMQLTGHLPRGVNPLLDQLITIHETVLAFIKTNSRTLDEIPTSFDDADAVAEYLDALEIVEEQMQEESLLLDTARDAKDTLILPPENTDDTLIRLTDLQRIQVKNLYDMLLNQWTDFEQLLSTTKCDLLRIESDLVDIEEGTHKYHAEADKVLDKIKELLRLLDQVAPRHLLDDDPLKDQPWHPLDECDQEGQMEQLATLYQEAAAAANEQVNLFESTIWKVYRRFILQFSRVVLKQVKTRLEELEQGYQQVINVNQDVQASSKDFSRALALISATTAIGVELESIHKLMDDNNHTTNDAILDLEKQINAVRTSIHNTREVYDDLLLKDERLVACVNNIQQQYEMVRDWVDQVRIWFIEAERIRKWIEVRIDIIQRRNESTQIDPLSDELDSTAQENAKLWHDEHVKLGREIDRFDADDMARLRTHVKTLTGTDRGDRELSPADTSTIEITLTTLNKLNQLMLLLRQRSYLVDMLTLRVRWNKLFDTSSQWITDTNRTIDEFLEPGQARWISSGDLGTSNGNGSTTSSISGDNTSTDTSDIDNSSNRRRQQGGPHLNTIDPGEMIQTLVALESKVIQFDQTLYSECLDAYQEMEDLHNGTLSNYLDTKQSNFEDSFGDLMKRSGFARRVVEQHLALLDIATQYRQLRDKGESLRASMISSSKSTSTRTSTHGNCGDDDSDSDVYGDQVQMFKEDSSQLITYVFSRIVYTDTPTYVTSTIGTQDAQENEQANDHIKEAVQGFAMQLATIAESLENLLASHRRALSLQQRATLAYEEMMRMIQWLEERWNMYNVSWLDKADRGGNIYHVDSETDDDDDSEDGVNTMERYQRELDSVITRMKQLEQGDLSRLRSRVSAIEDEIDASNAISIDRNTLINAIEEMDDRHAQLQQVLDQRALELAVMGKRQIWEEQWVEASGALDNVARQLWSLVDSINLQIDSTGDIEGDNTDDLLVILVQLSSLIQTIGAMPAFSSEGAYEDLETAYHRLNTPSSSSFSPLPAHVQEKKAMLNNKQHDLKQLFRYVQEWIEYNRNLKSLVDKTKEMAQDASQIYEEALQMFTSTNALQNDRMDSVMDDDGTSVASSVGADLVLKLQTALESLYDTRNDIHLPKNESVMFNNLRPTITSSSENTESFNKWLSTKHSELQSLLKTLEQLQSQYAYTLKAKQDAQHYTDEAKRQTEWIDKHLKLLRASHLDISDDTLAVDDGVIQDRHQALVRLSGDIATFKQDHMAVLKGQVEMLTRSTMKADGGDGAIGFDTNTLSGLLEQVSTGMTDLEQHVESETLVLEMISQYMEWKGDLQQLMKQIGSLQEQLYPLAAELKEMAVQDDLSTVDLQPLGKLCGSVETQVKKTDQAVQEIRSRFTDGLSLLIKAQLQPSAASTVCDRLETQLVGLVRSFGRCQETLKVKLQELDTLKEQKKWQEQMNKLLGELDDLFATVDTFIESKARWRPGMTMHENDEADLRHTWADIKSTLDNCCQHQVQPLQYDMQQWIDSKNSDAKSSSTVEWTAKMIQQMSDAHSVVEQHLIFGNDIITQRCLMTSFLWRTSQLEHSAEVIREEFLCQNDKASNGQGNGLTDHGERLKRFYSGIDDIRQDLATTIPLPVRKSSSMSSSRQRPGVKDETTNAIIRETIDTRLQRLQELANGLQSLLDSKERMSRQEMSRLLYAKQVEVCQGWIDTNRDKLKQALRLLDSMENDRDGVMSNQLQDIQQLRDAIGVAESIEAATRGNDTVLSSLQAAYNACKESFAGDKNGDLDGFTQEYEQLEDKWQSLQKEAIKSAKLLTRSLGPTEINNRIKILWQTIHGLQKDIDSISSSNLTDDHILQWQKQIDNLDKNDYSMVMKMTTSLVDNSNSNVSGSTNERPVSSTSISSETSCALSPSYEEDHQRRQQLDKVAEAILSIRNTLAHLYDVVNLNRLCNTYKENANIATSMIGDAKTVLSDIQQRYKMVDDISSVRVYRDALVDAYQDARQLLTDCKETYDDLSAYCYFIQTQKINADESDDLLSEIHFSQTTIDTNWKSLQAQGQSVSQLAIMATQLVQGYDTLSKMEQTTQVLLQDINDMPSSPSMEEVNSVERRVRDSTDTGMNEVKNILYSLEDSENAVALSEQHDKVATLISDMYQQVNRHKRQLERNKLLNALNEEVTRLQTVCEEQLKFIRQQILANPDLVGKRPESINHISQSYVAAISNIEKVYEKCKDDYQVISNQAKRLMDYYDVPLLQLENIKRPVEKALQDLDIAIQTENEYIVALKLVMKHSKTEVELVRSLSDMKATLLKYSKQGLRTRLHSLPDLTDFNRRNDDLTKSVQQFFSMGEDFKKSKLYKSIGVARTSSINKAVDHCQVIVKRMWTEIKGMMDETKIRLDEMYRRHHGVSKLNETLRYVDDIKDRINTLQLSGKSVTVEEGELNELDREIKETLAKKIQEMDMLLASISDSDGMIRKQRAQLSTATDQLHHLMQVRQEQAQTEGNITLFLGIIDQVDEQILQLLVAVENTAPHHARVVQGKFVKSELQDLLRRLVGVYKKTGPAINKLLASAKEEARKQFLDDNERVARRLEKTVDRWAKAQASAAAREKELHTCINALSHEFFTKLAMAKKKTASASSVANTTTSSVSNYSNGGRRLSRSMARSSTPVGESSTSSSSSVGSLPPPLGYTTGRRPSFQSTSLAADHRLTGNSARRSKTPMLSSSKPRSAYVSDPKNELDVQLGRIVNDSAYKISVKMVNGEVGKYYFGERLVYCRILPSKMVMVRVGGGWVELSQFLKDHSHSDNTGTRNKQNSNNASSQRDHQQEEITRSASPSGRVTLRGGANISSSSLNPNHSISKSSNRSKSPVSSGYCQGDTFIHIGEDGQQVVMKMTKAKEDATTPIKRFS